MNPSGGAVFIALLSLVSACRPVLKQPSEPEPRPACFTGQGAIAIPIPSPAPLEPRVPAQEGYGVGGLGLVGSGASSGKGEGTITITSPPTMTVIPGQPQFQGAVERDELRQTVRRHLRELATCPNLDAAPDYGGRIVVDLVIDRQGRVERSSIRSSTGKDPQVDRCVGEQVCRWTFTAPSDGGTAVVSYPLIFTPQKIPE